MENRITFSTKITILSFLLSIGVVYQHTVWRYTENVLLNSAHSFLFYIIQTCVPFFFVISGYLFYRTFNITKIKDKLLSRIRSLLIPYIIWNLIYAVFMITLTTMGFIQNANIERSVLGVIFQWINSSFSPLWFLKYLMIFVIISPIMYFMLKDKILGIITLIILILANIFFYYSGIMETPLDVNANNVVMLNYQYIFYAVGAYAALNLKKLIETPSRKKSYIALGVIVVLFLLYFFNVLGTHDVIINHTFRLVYACALWFLLDLLPEIKIQGWMKNSFFIYCSHLMLLQCAQAISEIIIWHTGKYEAVLEVAEYILLPQLIVIIILLFANVFKRGFPRVWEIITGSRG